MKPGNNEVRIQVLQKMTRVLEQRERIFRGVANGVKDE